MTTVAPSVRAAELSAEGVPFVYATVVRAVAPASARPGDNAVLHSDGRLEGFVGGVCTESSVRLYGLQALADGQPLLLRIVPEESQREQRDPDGTVTVGNPCLSGGAIEMFLEPRRPAPRLLVVGDTPVARALAELGRPLGFHVEVAADNVAPPSADDAALVVTSHGRDEPPALTAGLAAGVPYIALVASRRRGEHVLAGLAVDDKVRARIRTPAGLPIGARTAAEIALSILAELVSLRSDAVARADVRVQPELGDPAPLASAGGATGRNASATRPVATAVDPICGMTVAAVSGSLQLVGADGAVTYFCGTGCRAAYEAR